MFKKKESKKIAQNVFFCGLGYGGYSFPEQITRAVLKIFLEGGYTKGFFEGGYKKSFKKLIKNLFILIFVTFYESEKHFLGGGRRFNP